MITAIASTLYSGTQYVWHARRVLSADALAAPTAAAAAAAESES